MAYCLPKSHDTAVDIFCVIRPPQAAFEGFEVAQSNGAWLESKVSVQRALFAPERVWDIGYAHQYVMAGRWNK